MATHQIETKYWLRDEVLDMRGALRTVDGVSITRCGAVRYRLVGGGQFDHSTLDLSPAPYVPPFNTGDGLRYKSGRLPRMLVVTDTAEMPVGFRAFDPETNSVHSWAYRGGEHQFDIIPANPEKED